MLPKEPSMLLSVINTKLRDEYDSLEELCDGLDEDIEEITQILEKAGYRYDKTANRFH